jgi:hypothetical protein
MGRADWRPERQRNPNTFGIKSLQLGGAKTPDGANQPPNKALKILTEFLGRRNLAVKSRPVDR